jgi:putative FmdB family regulatory protein
MPFFEHRCPKHGVFEHYASIKQFTKVRECPDCGSPSPLIFSKLGKHIVDFTAGWNGGAGKHFDSKKDRETWMREKNMVRA